MFSFFSFFRYSLSVFFFCFLYCLATFKGLPGGKGRVRLGTTTVSCHVSRFLRNVPRPIHAHTHTNGGDARLSRPSPRKRSRVRFHSRRATKSCTNFRFFVGSGRWCRGQSRDTTVTIIEYTLVYMLEPK